MIFKKWKEEWLAKNESKIRQEFQKEENDLKCKLILSHEDLKRRINAVEKAKEEADKRDRELKTLERDIAEMIERTNDKKAELERVNNELRTQIRLIEAKASPDNIWVESFGAGFNKAWDMMMPLMTKGVENMKKVISDEATEKALKNLSPVIVDRKTSEELLEKIKSFETKLSTTKDKDDKAKYSHYIEALKWYQNGHNKKIN